MRPPAPSRGSGGRALLWGAALVAVAVGAVLAVVAMAAVAPGPRGPLAPPAPPATLRDLLTITPADSLPGALRRFESEHARTPEGTEALLALARFHYARGAYRAAAESYARAAARLEPANKSEARYWAGLAWLALNETARARAVLDEVASQPGPRQAAAQLAQAQLWELAQRPSRAAEILAGLLVDDPGEVGPAALERFAALAEAQGQGEEARRDRERMLREYPRSIEAAAARRAAFSPATARGAARARQGGSSSVVIGAFTDPARARSLAAAARAAGFAEAKVVSRGEGLSAIYLVRLGVYPGAAEARAAGVQAEQALGVTFEITRGD
jgi:tetratricopeptide (TPR) repeat protein